MLEEKTLALKALELVETEYPVLKTLVFSQAFREVLVKLATVEQSHALIELAVDREARATVIALVMAAQILLAEEDVPEAYRRAFREGD